METRFSRRLTELESRILRGPAELDTSVRGAAYRAEPIGDPVADRYLTLVHERASRIVDGDVAELSTAGWSENRIFELTISAALGAANLRMDMALRAVEAARSAADRADAGHDPAGGP